LKYIFDDYGHKLAQLNGNFGEIPDEYVKFIRDEIMCMISVEREPLKNIKRKEKKIHLKRYKSIINVSSCSFFPFSLFFFDFEC